MEHLELIILYLVLLGMLLFLYKSTKEGYMYDDEDKRPGDGIEYQTLKRLHEEERDYNPSRQLLYV
jgi:hypothetical protein